MSNENKDTVTDGRGETGDNVQGLMENSGASKETNVRTPSTGIGSRDETQTDRRSLLKAFGAAAATAIGGTAAAETAGITSIFNNNQGQGRQGNPGGGEEQAPTSLLEFDAGQPTVLPFVTRENRGEKGTATTQVEDQNGLEAVKVFLDNGAERHELAVHNALEGEEQQTLETQYPQRLVAPGDNQLVLRAVDSLGQEKQFKHSFTAESSGHIIDFKNSDGQDIGNYSTQRKWDNFQFNVPRDVYNWHSTDKERRNTIREQRQEWNRRQAYNNMIQKLDSKGEKKTYSDEWTSAYYPGDIDVWTRSKFRDHKDAEDVLRFASTATQLEQVAVRGIKDRSRKNYEFSATVEQLINEVHTEEEYERKVTTTHVNQVGHGTSVAYVHAEDADLEADNNWWFLDTTWKTVTPVEEATIHDGYNPFVQGYHGDQSDSGELSIEKEKSKASNSLLYFVHRSNDLFNGENIDFDKIGFSDPMLEFTYNDHILENDGHVDPVVEMVEKAGDYQLEESEYVTAVGDSWDELEFMAGQEIYEAAVDQEVRLTKDKAYDILGQTAA